MLWLGPENVLQSVAVPWNNATVKELCTQNIVQEIRAKNHLNCFPFQRSDDSKVYTKWQSRRLVHNPGRPREMRTQDPLTWNDTYFHVFYTILLGNLFIQYNAMFTCTIVMHWYSRNYQKSTFSADTLLLPLRCFLSVTVWVCRDGWNARIWGHTTFCLSAFWCPVSFTLILQDSELFCILNFSWKQDLDVLGCGHLTAYDRWSHDFACNLELESIFDDMNIDVLNYMSQVNVSPWQKFHQPTRIQR